MSKYEPLGQFLRGQTRNQIPMTFAEIEKILGAPLPASKKHRAWWSNNPSNNVMTREWLSAGYETESVNVDSGKLIFRRTAGAAPAAAKEDIDPARHPMFGCLKGMITFAEGYDPTEPTGEDWDSVYMGNDVQSQNP
jgi:hypothetical protein